MASGLKVDAVDEFHDEVAAAAFNAPVDDVHDVGVVEPGDHKRFLLESFDDFGVEGVLGGEDLDGHFALKRRLKRFVYLGDAALADLGDNPVITDRGRGRFGDLMLSHHSPCRTKKQKRAGEMPYPLISFGTEEEMFT